MDQRLDGFVAHARERGLDLATIRTLLVASGWKEKDVAAAFAARELDLPVPEPASVGSAREVFLHLLAFTALYTWVVGVVVLAFQGINLAFPDPAWDRSPDWRDHAAQSIRHSLAAIVVAFPVFLVLWRRLLQEVARQPEKARSRVGRALTYVSLYVGAVTLLCDVITLVYYLLEGELTLRFLIKVALLFVIAGSVFVYLLLTLRADRAETS